MRTEERLFAPHGVFLVGALIQENVGVTLAVTVGLFLGFALLLAAWIARSNEITSFSLALLASLLATPVSWPQYLLLMAVPLLIVWRTMAFAWVWFPALWHPLHAGPLTWSLYAALPAVFVVAAAARRPLARSPDFAGGMSQFADT
jgi:hypothetical protein